MAESFETLADAHLDFIREQKIFFTASAAAAGRVNLSPRSTEAFRILDPSTVAYRDLTGSGNETAAHIFAGGRLTIMFCSFEHAPRILRLFGRGTVAQRESDDYRSLLASFYDNAEPAGTRQIIVLKIDLVRTACGYGVPLFSYEGERDALRRWTDSKTESFLKDYRFKNNARSIDGFEGGFSD